MCGIIVARSLSDNNVNGQIWEQFEKQRSRGVDGFGAFDGRSIFKTPKLKKMRGWLRNQKHGSDFIMFHHRWPTSTVNVRRAAHPFSTGDYFGKVKYVLVHNGHVSNSKALKEKHEALGIEYTSVLEDGTFNDSESLLWDVALTLEGKQEKLEAYGGIAFVASKVVDNDITQLYFAKNAGRPLKLHRDDDNIMLSSEGIGTEIDDHKLYTYNYKLNRLTSKYFRVPAYANFTGTYNGNYNSNLNSSNYNSNWDDDERNYPYTSGQRKFTFGYGAGDGNAAQSHNVNQSYYDASSDREQVIGVEGVDYEYDKDGKRVYYNWDWENDDDSFVEDNLDYAANYYGKSPYELDVEMNEQDWYIKDYIGVDADDLRSQDVYDHYMTLANGSFVDAFDFMDTDIDHFSAQATTPKCRLIVNALEQAMIRLTTVDTFRSEEEHVDENYFSPVAKLGAPFTNQMLIGAAQEG